MNKDENSDSRSYESIMDQVDAIKRRCASSNVGTVPMAGSVAQALDDNLQDRRFNWLDYLRNWLHRDCD